MPKRNAIGQKKRFEIFKRDSFTCQYCGKKSPDVVLNVDHIEPVSKGGDNSLMNLITACFDCNSGKSDRLLGDRNEIDKAHAQIEELQERENQLKMMMKWRKGLLDLKKTEIDSIAEYWEALTDNDYSLNKNGLSSIKKMLKKYSIDEIINAMDEAASTYFKTINNKLDKQSVEKATDKLIPICKNLIEFKDKPYMKDILYISGILKNTYSPFNQRESIELMDSAYQCGCSLETLKLMADNYYSYSDWREDIREIYTNDR